MDVLAIGSLARNTYWKEKAAVRQEYATTTLLRSADAVIVVDPGWPPDVLERALFYRAGLEPKAVTHVFLTHMDPAHFMGIGIFEKARWLAYDEEIRWADAEAAAGDPVRPLLARLKAAPERLAPGIDLFPTFGHTPGHCSLLVFSPMQNLVVAGDAALTRDHFEHGDLGDGPWDLEKAKESFTDVVEIADAVVPGHDNVVLCRMQGI
jgi:glyoxylase-like metal-dependent hydrolase (beta-lactamase superfamily II)